MMNVQKVIKILKRIEEIRIYLGEERDELRDLTASLSDVEDLLTACDEAIDALSQYV